MSNGMIATTVIIERFPIFDRFGVPSVFCVVGRGVAPEIPRRTSIAIKSVGFAGHFFAVYCDF